MKRIPIIQIFINIIDLVTLIAMIVALCFDPSIAGWITFGVLMTFMLSYFIVSTYLVTMIGKIKGRRIPTPHGRLIDADVAEQHMKERLREIPTINESPICKKWFEVVLITSVIDRCPTVVKAERGERHMKKF